MPLTNPSLAEAQDLATMPDRIHANYRLLLTVQYFIVIDVLLSSEYFVLNHKLTCRPNINLSYLTVSNIQKLYRVQQLKSHKQGKKAKEQNIYIFDVSVIVGNSQRSRGIITQLCCISAKGKDNLK